MEQSLSSIKYDPFFIFKNEREREKEKKKQIKEESEKERESKRQTDKEERQKDKESEEKDRWSKGFKMKKYHRKNCVVDVEWCAAHRSPLN